jgi:pyroglutamyl-peptidase
LIRILLTAFGAFPGAPVNPTMKIASALQKRHRRFERHGIFLETRVLPVVFEGVRVRLEEMIVETRPDIVLHLGLAGRRKTMSVETRALNRLTLLHVDALRKYSGSIFVEGMAPLQRRSRFAASRLAQTMGSAGARSRLSIDAGDYLCNQTLYHSLGLHAGMCGFVHIPRPKALRRPLRTAGWPPDVRPSLAAMAAAIERALVQLAADHRVYRRS